MKRLLIASLAIAAAFSGVNAQTADKKDPGVHAPNKAMEEATPTMKGPAGGAEHPPTGRMDTAVPPMKPGDHPAASGGSTTAGGAAAGAKLSANECDALWKLANPTNTATITEAQSKQYVADFKAANPDNDRTLDKAEFSLACSNGLVTNSSSSTTTK